MINASALAAGLAIDPEALGDLRTRAAKDPDGTLKEAARQFETLFLDMMLKSMRSAARGDSLFDSEGTQAFIGLLDHEYSRKLADKGGLGLADLLVRQLSQLEGERVQSSAAVKKSGGLPIKT